MSASRQRVTRDDKPPCGPGVSPSSCSAAGADAGLRQGRTQACGRGGCRPAAGADAGLRQGRMQACGRGGRRPAAGADAGLRQGRTQACGRGGGLRWEDRTGRPYSASGAVSGRTRWGAHPYRAAGVLTDTLGSPVTMSGGVGRPVATVGREFEICTPSPFTVLRPATST